MQASGLALALRTEGAGPGTGCELAIPMLDALVPLAGGRLDTLSVRNGGKGGRDAIDFADSGWG